MKTRVIARDFYESAYEDFFIQYYLALGFDSIVLIKADEFPVPENKYPADKVQFLHVKNTGNDLLIENIAYYTDTAYDWVLGVDMDEFLVFDTSKFPSIKEYLCDMEVRYNPDQIMYRWVCINKMSMWPDDMADIDVFESYITKHNLEIFRSVKCLARPSRISSANITPHYFFPRDNDTAKSFVNLLDGAKTNKIEFAYDIKGKITLEDGFILHANTRTLANAVTKNLVTAFQKKQITGLGKFIKFIKTIDDKTIIKPLHRKQLYDFMAWKSVFPYQVTAFHNKYVKYVNMANVHRMLSDIVNNLKTPTGDLLVKTIPFMSITQEYEILETVCKDKGIDFIKLKTLLMALNNVPDIKYCNAKQLSRYL